MNEKPPPQPKIPEFHATSLRGCVGWMDGIHEYGVVDSDGGYCICATSRLCDAELIAGLLNHELWRQEGLIDFNKN